MFGWQFRPLRSLVEVMILLLMRLWASLCSGDGVTASVEAFFQINVTAFSYEQIRIVVCRRMEVIYTQMNERTVYVYI